MFFFLAAQDTLTILCHEFPLISTINDSSLQCARLRIDETVSSINFDLYNSSQTMLFIVIDQPLPSVNIIVNFNQSPDFSSSINEIHIGLLVIHSSFTINNQTTSIYSSNQIPILHWKKSAPDRYDLIDLLTLHNDEYKTDKSMCQWNIDQWNHIFYGNSTNKPPYAYILKTTNPNLIFTLANTMNISLISPYLTTLYCIPYQFGIIEIILIVVFSVVFLLILVTLSILYYFKDRDNLSRYFRRKTLDISPIYPNPSRISFSISEYID